MSRRTVLDVSVEDVEKRKYPSKHYVYEIKVSWSDQTASIIYRRYSKFFSFQNKLLDQFPIEAGAVNPAARIIPFLPGKILFGRSHIRSVALQRLNQIHEYCKKLVRLPAKISECELVMSFFETKPEDINPPKKESSKSPKAEKISEPLVLDQYVAIADYEKVQKNEVSLVEGMVVEVVEKKENGWWFVSVEEEQGWVPGSYLERADGVKEEPVLRARQGKEEKFLVIESYAAQNSDEITLPKGAIVQVVERNMEGWWYIRYKGKEGWGPATFLKRPDTIRRDRLAKAKPTQAVEIVSNIKEVSNIFPSKPEPLKPGERTEEEEIYANADIAVKYRPPPRKNSVSQRSSRKKPARPGAPPQKAVYMTLEDFRDTVGDGLSFKRGETAQVIQKSDTGWWYVEIGNREGWVPSDFIEKQTRPLTGQMKPNAKQQIKESKPIAPKASPRTQAKFPAANSETSSPKLTKNKFAVKREEMEGKNGHSLTAKELKDKFEKTGPSEGKIKPKVEPRVRTEAGTKDIGKRNVSPRQNIDNKKQDPVKLVVLPKVSTPPPRPKVPPSRPSVPPKTSNVQHHAPRLKASGDATSLENGAAPKNMHGAGSKSGLVSQLNSVFEKNLKLNNNEWKGATSPSAQRKTNQVKNPTALSRVKTDTKKSMQSCVDVQEDFFVAAADYDDPDGDFNFKEGQLMKLLDKDPSGWWYMEMNGDEGWAPSNFLEKRS